MKRIEQKEIRRKEILIKSMELFIKKGYYETKITDIAESVEMSVGLLFHYFNSKEDLYYELVKIGVQATKSIEKLKNLPPDIYFKETLKQIFDYSINQPWVFKMFILMNLARREGVPEKIRNLASSVDQIEFSAKIIEKGQKDNIFREGDPYLLSTCFWASVQGIMEQMATKKEITMPNPEWILAILKKEENK